MEIPEKYKITDNRIDKDFLEKTFSGYLKKDVLTIFNKSILNGKIEAACNWAIELLCSGYVEKIYEKIYTIIMKHINTNNLELIKIYYDRFSTYSRFKSKTERIINMRNYQNIRNHIVELCTLACLSMKSKPISAIKITQDHFNPDLIKSKFRADKSIYIDKYYRCGDPLELKIFFNEFIYALIGKSYNLSIYWLYWLVEWEKINIKKEKLYQCGYRNIDGIDKKHMTDMIWLIWEILLNVEINDYINTLFNLYKLGYSPSKKNKKMPILIVAIKIYTDTIIKDNIHDKHSSLIIQVCGNVNNLFIERKQYEKRENNDKIHASNLETHNNSQKPSPKKKDLSKKSNQKINAISELDLLMLNNLAK
jgi:hypothetical protein